jgi:hypothetical protein
MSAMGRAIQSLCLVLSVIGGVLARAPALADSVPFWDAKASVPLTPKDLDPVHPKLMECPYPFYDVLRREAPVYKVPNADYFIVSRFADVQDALRRHDDLSNDVSHLFDGQGSDSPNHLQTRRQSRQLPIAICCAFFHRYIRTRAETFTGTHDANKGTMNQ